MMLDITRGVFDLHRPMHGPCPTIADDSKFPDTVPWPVAAVTWLVVLGAVLLVVVGSVR